MKLNKVIALDIGSKNTGIAISDSTQTIAFPLKTIKTENLREEIKNIIQEEGIEKIIIGENLYQNKNFRVKEITKKHLDEFKDITEFINEDFSTEKAKEIYAGLNKKNRPEFTKIKDELAAKVILDSYLNQNW